MMNSITIKPGRVQPVWAGHPWVYAQAVGDTSGRLEPGCEVGVLDAKGNFLGTGLYSPKSAIAVRLFTRRKRPIDAALFRQRLERALALRRALGLPDNETTAYRWVHGEGDGLPGLIVDVFGKQVSVQLGTIGLWQRRELIFQQLEALMHPTCIYDRTPPRLANLEGFEVGPAVVEGEAAPLQFAELGIRYSIPFELQQKTGYYCDQRPLRRLVRELAQGKRVIDAYSYVGAVGLNAARGGGRSVVCVDRNESAIETARELASMQGCSETITAVHGDVMQYLEQAPNHSAELIICDPPKLAQSRRGKDSAQRLLRALARQACRVCTKDGIVILSSCSAAVGVQELSRALALGALDSAMQVQVTQRLFQGPDHPVLAGFAEGDYLSTVVGHLTPRD